MNDTSLSKVINRSILLKWEPTGLLSDLNFLEDRILLAKKLEELAIYTMKHDYHNELFHVFHISKVAYKNFGNNFNVYDIFYFYFNNLGIIYVKDSLPVDIIIKKTLDKRYLGHMDFIAEASYDLGEQYNPNKIIKHLILESMSFNKKHVANKINKLYG